MIVEWSECECPIWGTPAERKTITSGDFFEYKSDRAGGLFYITGSAERHAALYCNKRITAEILRSNLTGVPLRLTSADIPEVDDLPPLTVIEKYNAFLLILSKHFSQIGSGFTKKSIFYGQIGRLMQAGIGSHNLIDGADREEIELFVATGVSQGHLVEQQPGSGFYLISFAGWQKIESLGVSLKESNQIFVAMWFGSAEQTSLYHLAIKPAIELAGYTSVRIDDTQHNAKIDDRIIAEIRKSKAVIVDMTCGLARPIGNWSRGEKVGAPRGGVFYEAGFASGLNLPVIWTVKNEQAEIENVVHFDVRQFNQIRWTDDLADFSEKLRFRIEATLGRGTVAKLST